MTEKKDKSTIISSNPISHTHLGELVLDQITDALHELNIARKAALLYPIEHRQVQQSTQQACKRLELIFSTIPEVNFGIAAGKLIFAGKTLDPGNTIYKDLAQSLTNQGIVVLTLLKGLVASEIARFFSLLTSKQNQSSAEDGFVRSLDKNGIHHIRVTLIDYSQFKVTEESEIKSNKATDGSPSHQNIWHDFAIQLMEGSSGQTSRKDIQPQKIAQLLNENPEKINIMLPQYEYAVKNYLQETQHDHQLNAEKNHAIKGINNLLKELNPHLRQQFLNSTLSQCNQAPEKPQTYQFISQLSQDVIGEMLHEANLKEGSISESLKHLIQKISPTISDHDISPSIGDALELIGTKKDQFQELFKKEDYQKFVDQDYDHTLRHLGQNPADGERTDTILNKIENLGPLELDQHILQALNGLMKQCHVPAEYIEYATKIVEIAKENIEQKNFDIAFEAMAIFHQHHSTEKSGKMAQMARNALAQLTDSKLLEDFIHTLDNANTKLPPAIGQLLSAIGPQIVPPLVKRFMSGGHGEKSFATLKILAHFKKESVATAHEMVEYNDVDQIKKLIFLIRQINDRASSAYLRSLVAHANPTVNREALAALLYFKDPWGILFLRDRLNSEDPDEVVQAIAMAGDYRITEMIPHLAASLKFGALSKNDIKRNSHIVTAMGKICDAAAIPHLTKLVQNTWSFYRSNLKQLKIDIFKSLANYPINEIKPVLALGSKLKDKAINQVCNQLIKPKPTDKISK